MPKLRAAKIKGSTVFLANIMSCLCSICHFVLNILTRPVLNLQMWDSAPSFFSPSVFAV